MRSGLDALEHRVRDAVRERVGLAGAGAGDDQQRPRAEQAPSSSRVAKAGGCALGGIEPVESGYVCHEPHYRRLLVISPVGAARYKV